MIYDPDDDDDEAAAPVEPNPPRATDVVAAGADTLGAEDTIPDATGGLGAPYEIVLAPEGPFHTLAVLEAVVVVGVIVFPL
jgi:hypothetical protein